MSRCHRCGGRSGTCPHTAVLSPEAAERASNRATRRTKGGPIAFGRTRRRNGN